MLIYNLIKYSDNYSGTSGSLWGFKRDEVANNAKVTNNNNFNHYYILHLNTKQTLLVMLR